MKFINFEFGVGEEYNSKIFAKIYSDSKKTYNLNIELDENDEKVISFDCTCKGVTIPKSMGNPIPQCKHIKQLIEVVKLMGYIQQEQQAEKIFEPTSTSQRMNEDTPQTSVGCHELLPFQNPVESQQPGIQGEGGYTDLKSGFEETDSSSKKPSADVHLGDKK